MYFSYFVIKGVALNLNKLESPSHKDSMYQVWLNLAQWFWRRGFLNLVNVFSLFHYHMSPWHGPWFEQTWILFTKRMLCVQFGWNRPRDTGKEDENVKNLQTDTTGNQKSSIWRERRTQQFFKSPRSLHGELSISLSDGRLTDLKRWIRASFSKIPLKIHLICNFYYIFNQITGLKHLDLSQ